MCFLRGNSIGTDDGRQTTDDRRRTTHHLPALIYSLFCGNTKYFPPQKNPTGST